MELTNGDNDESQNVIIWKFTLAFLQAFLDDLISFGWQSVYLLSGNKNKRFGDTKLWNENFSLSALVAHIAAKQVNREFKIYDATVAKTLLKISISSLSVIMSICLTFES